MPKISFLILKIAAVLVLTYPHMYGNDLYGPTERDI